MQHEDSAVPLKSAQAINMLRPEGEWLPDVLRSALRLLHLEANSEIAGQQPEADGDAVGMEPIADQVIEVMAVLAFLDRLFCPPPLPIGLGQPLGTSRAQAGDVDPRPPFIGRRACAERKESQPIIPGTTPQPHGASILEPAALLGGEPRQSITDWLGAGKAQDEGHATVDQRSNGPLAGEAAVGHDPGKLLPQELTEMASQQGNEAAIPGLAADEQEGHDGAGVG